MSIDDPQSTAPWPERPARVTWIRAAAVCAIVLGGLCLRWCYLGAPTFHPDEAFPVALIGRYRATGDLDVNLAKVPLPGSPIGDQYAGSAYHHIVVAWDALLRRTGWPDSAAPDAALIRVRAFSALMASLALALFARIAWLELGFAGAAAAAALAAVNPVLVQDAHFARPDSLLLVLAVAFMGLCRTHGALSLRRAAALGVILGVLTACKNTMGLLAALPFVAVAAGGASFRRAAGPLALFAVVAAAAFLAAEPESWLHFRQFMAGLRTLSAQYSQPFPAQGPIDGGTTFAMAGRYFYATLGISTATLVALGAYAWFRARAWLLFVAWLLPAVAFSILFGSRTNFFERSYGTFLPGVFLAAGAGAALLARGKSPGPVLAVFFSVMAAYWGGKVTATLVTQSLSGRAEALHQTYARRLRAAAAPVPVVNTWLCAPAQLDECLRLAAQVHGPLILAVGDFGDDWTARSIRQLKAALPVREIAVIKGPFADLPMSSLQCYNGPTFRYLWVGRQPPPPLPVP
jgi:hypothetical protein